MSALAIIPARSGSKRIPNKNIKNFHGAPIISYPIRAAMESGLFSQVYVSTDSSEIADIARTFGATVPWLRGKKLSNGTATTLDVMTAELKQHLLNGKLPENVCCLYPATPLLSAELLREGFQKLISGNWDYVISVTKNEFQPQRILTLDTNHQIRMLFPNFEQTRTQDLRASYSDAGQFYWGTSTAWLNSLPIFTSTSTIIQLPCSIPVDIDTPEDWVRVEKLFGKLHQ